MVVEEGEEKRESDEEIEIATAVMMVLGEEVGGCNGGG